MEWTSLLTELVKMIKSTAPEVWRIAIRQSYTLGIQNSIAFLSTTIIAFFSTREGLKAAKKHKERKNRHDDDQFFLSVTLCIIAFIAMIFAIIAFAGMVSYFINPEYYAILSLVNLVK